MSHFGFKLVHDGLKVVSFGSIFTESVLEVLTACVGALDLHLEYSITLALKVFIHFVLSEL
jgi:hypothetical protein